MGDGVDEAAIDQRERVGHEACRNGDAVGAVAVEQKRRAAVELRILAIEQSHRNGLAVLRRCKDAPRHVEARVVSARNLLRLPQGALLRLHIVVIGLGGGRHRRIGEAQRRRVVFVARAHAERIGFLVESDGMFFAVRETADDNARQSILPFQPDEEILERDHIEDQPSRPVRFDLGPILGRGGVCGRLDDAEIVRTSRIGQNNEPPFVVAHGVFVFGRARCHEPRRRVRVGRVDQAHFGRFVVVCAEKQILAIQRHADIEEEAGIGLVVDETIFARLAQLVRE